MYGIGYLCYYLTNHHPFSTPVLLPRTWIDIDTPFIPETVLVYTSEYFYFAFVYISLRNYDNINKYLYSFFLLQVVSCAVFIGYPTIYPRDSFPIDQVQPDWIRHLWIWLRNQDAPTNCFPSLHVSSVYLSSLVYLTDGPVDREERAQGRTEMFWFTFIWATAIAISTLTTKQHYLADILSGFSLAVFFYWWFHHRQKYFRFSPAISTKQI